MVVDNSAMVGEMVEGNSRMVGRSGMVGFSNEVVVDGSGRNGRVLWNGMVVGNFGMNGRVWSGAEEGNLWPWIASE